MKYLGVALFAEGPTDHRFLSPLLIRTCEAVCLEMADERVEIGGMVELHSFRDGPRGERIADSALEAAPAWHILFVHTDGGGDWDVAWRERVYPAAELLAKKLVSDHDVVAVVPVRETEAWILADPEALREVFGLASWPAGTKLIQKPGDVEALADPKGTLEEIYSCIRRSGNVKKYFELLGERISLLQLAAVPAFARFRADLIEALVRLHVLRS